MQLYFERIRYVKFVLQSHQALTMRQQRDHTNKSYTSNGNLDVVLVFLLIIEIPLKFRLWISHRFVIDSDDMDGVTWTAQFHLHFQALSDSGKSECQSRQRIHSLKDHSRMSYSMRHALAFRSINRFTVIRPLISITNLFHAQHAVNFQLKIIRFLCLKKKTFFVCFSSSCFALLHRIDNCSHAKNHSETIT